VETDDRLRAEAIAAVRRSLAGVEVIAAGSEREAIWIAQAA